jgi:RimJ/RimL family protein N-acetyltransferase
VKQLNLFALHLSVRGAPLNISISSNFSDLYMRPYDRSTDAFQAAAILLDPRTWSGGFADSSRIPDSMEDALQLVDSRHENHTMFSVLKPSHNETVGFTGVTLWDYPRETAKIGRTLINPNHWGKGVNHEVKLMFLDWLFSDQIGRVECDVAPTNVNSMRSLERFGFTFEGVRRRSAQRSDGAWRDTAVFSMIIEEWPFKRELIVDSILARNSTRLQSS